MREMHRKVGGGKKLNKTVFNFRVERRCNMGIFNYKDKLKSFKIYFLAFKMDYIYIISEVSN